MTLQTFTIHTDAKEYALINYEEIITYYNLPFYKKWFNTCPIKEFTEILVKK